MITKQDLRLNHDLIGGVERWKRLGDVDLTSELEQVVREMGVLKENEALSGFKEVWPEWMVGGDAYTMLIALQVSQDDGTTHERKFLRKAIHVNNIDEMLRRQEELVGIGVAVAPLYGVHSGCINQGFIPYSLEEAKQMGLIDASLRDKIIETAAKVDHKGFLTLSFVSDLRTDGKEVFYFDFGFDLGSAGTGPNHSALHSVKKFFAGDPVVQAEVESKYKQYYQQLDSPGQKA